MTDETVSARDNYERRRIAVLDSEMAYVEAGADGPLTTVFLHGNPTSSYLWRNIIPHLELHGRCLAPDLMGMGRSGPTADGSYRFVDHARYLDAWFEAVGVGDRVLLVIHDWGSALGFHWARRHPDRVTGIAYMEALVAPRSWQDWPEKSRALFQAFRSEAGEEMILQKNIFVEKVLPASVIRELGEAEMAVYRSPFMEPGETRRPMLTWPREIPIDGTPADVHDIMVDYSAWLQDSDVPKLFVNADPGTILVGRQREICRGWAHQEEVTVAGRHFIQEDSPAAIGAAVAAFAARIA